MRDARNSCGERGQHSNASTAVSTRRWAVHLRLTRFCRFGATGKRAVSADSRSPSWPRRPAPFWVARAAARRGRVGCVERTRSATAYRIRR